MSSTKSIWAITEDDECHLFCDAEVREAVAVAIPAQVWAVASNIARPFGRNGEVLARFIPPQSGSTDWHGHPVGAGSPGSIKTAPSVVIKIWQDNNVISRAFAKKLRKQAL